MKSGSNDLNNIKWLTNRNTIEVWIRFLVFLLYRHYLFIWISVRHRFFNFWTR